MRVGFGYDMHGFAEGRKLMLGGVEVAHPRGLAGHSDADVLIHAVIDALLGAAGMGDIGRHFPPGDPAYKDISSLELLKRTAGIIRDGGFEVVNVDSTVVCEEPQLKNYIPAMVEAMARSIECNSGRVNVKATTTEGLGPEGRGEGISAYAAALVKGTEEGEAG